MLLVADDGQGGLDADLRDDGDGNDAAPPMLIACMYVCIMQYQIHTNEVVICIPGVFCSGGAEVRVGERVTAARLRHVQRGPPTGRLCR